VNSEITEDKPIDASTTNMVSEVTSNKPAPVESMVPLLIHVRG